VAAAGAAGFLGLLIAAAYIQSEGEVLGISALICFFGFGAVNVVLDLRASRVSRRCETGRRRRFAR
jgi:hypothetical protein